jgi:hypothetical protein
MNIKRFILAWIVTTVLFLVLDMIFGTLGGFLTANITGAPIQGPVGLESKIFTGLIFEVINGFILVLIYAVIHPSIPGEGLVKGIYYGFIVWTLRVLMWAFSTYMMFEVSSVLLVVTTILGLIEVLILCVVIAAIYKKP